jgi:heme exporter protein D
MTGISEFLHMGGYAVYVWSSYGLTLLILFLNYILPIKREKNLINKIAKQYSGKYGQSE